MKKFYVLIVALIIGATASVSALDLTSYPSAFKKGNIALNAGIGLGYNSFIRTMGIPPLSASVDVAVPIADLPFSFGGIVGFSTSTQYYGITPYTYSDINICGRGAYHFNFDVKGLDTYAGLSIGYDIGGTNSPYEVYPGYFAFGVYIGARYFFNPNIAVFAETSSVFSYLTAGVTFKI